MAVDVFGTHRRDLSKGFCLVHRWKAEGLQPIAGIGPHGRPDQPIQLSLGDLDQAREAFSRSLDRYVRLQHTEGVSYCLDTASAIALRQGDKRRAALLMGAAIAARDRTGGSLPPVEQRLHDETVAQLADDELAEGAELDLDAAVALARV